MTDADPGGPFAPEARVAAEYWGLTQGEMAVELLRSAGIPARITRNDKGTALYLTITGAPRRPPVAVSVPAGDLERARGVLKDLLFPIDTREQMAAPESAFDEAAWREADAAHQAGLERAAREAAEAQAREAERSRRYEALRAQVVRSVRGNLRTPDERRMPETQAALSYPRLVALGRDPDTLTAAGRAVHRALMEEVERALG